MRESCVGTHYVNERVQQLMKNVLNFPFAVNVSCTFILLLCKLRISFMKFLWYTRLFIFLIYHGRCGLSSKNNFTNFVKDFFSKLHGYGSNDKIKYLVCSPFHEAVKLRIGC